MVDLKTDVVKECMSMKIIVTGGAGFIGTALVDFLLANTVHSVISIDKLSYASAHNSVCRDDFSHRYYFYQQDICDRKSLESIFSEHRPDAVIHLAAESHVDRSIDDPSVFLQSNIVGTFTLLEVARKHWQALPESDRARFRFLHVSTDEVFGDLGAQQGKFDEDSQYQPSSPYAATKAAADHLVRAWHRTYGLPIVVTNCSNNFGPYQYPEKLIPLTILRALSGKKIPVYGSGSQIRDWIYVEDHARALLAVLESGVVGETYLVGAHCEQKNIDVVKTICSILDRLRPIDTTDSANVQRAYAELIEHVVDRPGHDVRYAIDASKLMANIGFAPTYTFEQALEKTVSWYLNNHQWSERLLADGNALMRAGKKSSL